MTHGLPFVHIFQLWFISRSSTLTPVHLAPLVQSIRRENVILDSDLAELYGVAAKVLNQAVKRNRERFPGDFMFQLTPAEFAELRRSSGKAGSSLGSQIVTSKDPRGGRRSLPYAFTEQGVAMLSSVLRSPRAVEVNIAIMRTFVQLRRLMDSNRDLAARIESMEAKYDEQFATVFAAIHQLIAEDEAAKARPRRRIGFHPET
jgi:hypothetical protein